MRLEGVGGDGEGVGQGALGHGRKTPLLDSFPKLSIFS